MTQIEANASPIDRQMQLFAKLESERPAPRARDDYPGVASYYDLTYAVVPGFRPLVLDLHVPRTSGTFPVLVWAHGGGWARGSRTMGHVIDLVQHGYALAAVQYRLSGEAKFPAQLHDLKAAVRWLRASAPQFRLDADHIGVWGASAGGHLVSLLGLTANRPEFEGTVGEHTDPSSAVQAVIDYFGVTDFFAMQRPAEGTPGGNPVTGLLGFPIADRPDEARQAMPLSHVRSDAPAFLIVHGDADPVVPPAQSDALHAALTRAGADSTSISLPGALHEDPAFWSDETLGQVRAFLDRTLRT